MPLHTINILEYENVKKSDNYIILLSSGFCEPCKEIISKIEDLNHEITTYKILIDTDDDDEIEESFKTFNMEKIPTLIKYENNKEILRSVGKNDCLDNFFNFYTSEIKDDDDF